MRFSDWSSDVCSSDLSSRGLSPGPIRVSARRCRARLASPHRTARALGPGNKCRDDSPGCPGDRRVTGFIQRNGIVISTYLIGAVAVWMIVMIVLPQAYMLDYSFRHKIGRAHV